MANISALPQGQNHIFFFIPKEMKLSFQLSDKKVLRKDRRWESLCSNTSDEDQM